MSIVGDSESFEGKVIALLVSANSWFKSTSYFIKSLFDFRNIFRDYSEEMGFLMDLVSRNKFPRDSMPILGGIIAEIIMNHEHKGNTRKTLDLILLSVLSTDIMKLNKEALARFNQGG